MTGRKTTQRADIADTLLSKEFRAAAQRRGLMPLPLAIRLLERIREDDLFDAVLDDMERTT